MFAFFDFVVVGNGILFAAGAINNDNMVTALATWGVYLALYTLKHGLLWHRTLGLGLLAGLAALSKLSGALLLPLALLVIPLAATRQGNVSPRGIRSRHFWRLVVGHWSLALLPFDIGKRFGHFFEGKIEAIGGFILICLGIKILIEHLVS